MDTQELTRETRYKQVWRRPMRQVAAELGISDVALKKICPRMEIPTPLRGYWRRRELGYEPKVPSFNFHAWTAEPGGQHGYPERQTKRSLDSRCCSNSSLRRTHPPTPI